MADRVGQAVPAPGARVVTWAGRVGAAVRKAAEVLRIVDAHDGRVSLTAVLLGAAGAAVVAVPSWPGVVALLIAAGLYGHRRVVNQREGDRDVVLKRLAEDVAAAAGKAAALQEVEARLARVENRTQHLAGPRRG